MSIGAKSIRIITAIIKPINVETWIPLLIIDIFVFNNKNWQPSLDIPF
jgi:hypothetical protein